MAANHYVVLGVSADATPDEIKSAYRQSVKELHPDYYGEDSMPFLQIQEAYDVLNDPDRRRAYDEQIRTRPSYFTLTAVRPEPVAEWRRSPVQPFEEVRKPVIEEVFLHRTIEIVKPAREEMVDRFWRKFWP